MYSTGNLSTDIAGTSNYARLRKATPGYTRVCQATPGYPRLCQAMPGYDTNVTIRYTMSGVPFREGVFNAEWTALYLQASLYNGRLRQCPETLS